MHLIISKEGSQKGETECGSVYLSLGMFSHACIFRWKLNIVIAFLRNLYLSKYPNIEHLEGKNIPLYAHVRTYYIRCSGFWDVLFRELDIQVYDVFSGMSSFLCMPGELQPSHLFGQFLYNV